jgi:hypothetical protein
VDIFSSLTRLSWSDRLGGSSESEQRCGVARHFSRQTRSVLGQPFPRWLVAIDAFGPRTQQEHVVTAPRPTLSVPKRLENGKFKWPTRDAASIELTEHELALLLDGVDFTRIRRLPAFSLHAPPP